MVLRLVKKVFGGLQNVLTHNRSCTDPQNITMRVLSSYPRSGTHWLKKMISDVLGMAPFEDRLILDDSKLIYALQNESPNRLVYDHFDYDLHGSILNPNAYPDLRLILLYRNPLDVMISQFYRLNAIGMLPYKDTDPIKIMKTYIRFAVRDYDDSSIGGKLFFTENSDDAMGKYMAKWLNRPLKETIRRHIIGWIEAGYCLPIRYEDLVRETPRQLTMVLNYLNIPHSERLIDKSIQKNSFKSLSGGRDPGVMDVNSHYRKGVPKEWKRVFNKGEIELLKYSIGDQMDCLGYTFQ